MDVSVSMKDRPALSQTTDRDIRNPERAKTAALDPFAFQFAAGTSLSLGST